MSTNTFQSVPVGTRTVASPHTDTTITEVTVTPVGLTDGTQADDADLAAESLREPLTRERFYFVMADRFANGSTDNDRGGLTGGRLETGFDPSDKAFYHGGDLAGLTDRCDFTEQHRLEGGALRPDLVVHLAGGRSIVVDAKVPLDAFLDGVEATEDDDRAAALTRHARQLRTHVEQLASKRYWTALPAAPEFVVLFVPGEAILSAALEQDRDLLDHAATRQVVLASPTTLVALLRTVAQGWRHEALAEDAREVHRLGRELHERLGTMAGHLDKVGRSLRASVEAYNAAIGSLESRVLVSARRLGDLGDLPETGSPGPVDAVPRALTLAAEADQTPARRAHGA